MLLYCWYSVFHNDHNGTANQLNEVQSIAYDLELNSWNRVYCIEVRASVVVLYILIEDLSGFRVVE